MRDDLELDELLQSRNPNGGRPMRIGQTVFLSLERDGVVDVSQVKEEIEQRFHLGYCVCGKKIVIGRKRAEIVSSMFHKYGIKPVQRQIPIRLRLARYIARNLSTDNV